MTLDDLAAHATERTTRSRFDWNGRTIYAHPPNSQAAVASMILGAREHGAATDLD